MGIFLEQFRSAVGCFAGGRSRMKVDLGQTDLNFRYYSKIARNIISYQRNFKFHTMITS